MGGLEAQFEPLNGERGEGASCVLEALTGRPFDEEGGGEGVLRRRQGIEEGIDRRGLAGLEPAAPDLGEDFTVRDILEQLAFVVVLDEPFLGLCIGEGKLAEEAKGLVLDLERRDRGPGSVVHGGGRFPADPTLAMRFRISSAEVPSRVATLWTTASLATGSVMRAIDSAISLAKRTRSRGEARSREEPRRSILKW